MSTPLNIPPAGSEISDSDFVRLSNRAQAIILLLQTYQVSERCKVHLEHANEQMKRAMGAKIGR